MNSKGIYKKEELKLLRSFIYSRLEKEYLAKSYELLVPIIELDIQNNFDKSNSYENDQIKQRG